MTPKRPLPMTANVTHGRVATYRVYYCRCDDCTEAQRIAMADYYSRHPEQVEKKRLAMQARRSGIPIPVAVPESRLERELRLAREAERR